MQVRTLLRIRLDLAQRYPRKLKISTSKNIFTFFYLDLDIKCVRQLQKQSFPIKVKIGVDSGQQCSRHKETIEFITHHEI